MIPPSSNYQALHKLSAFVGHYHEIKDSLQSGQKLQFIPRLFEEMKQLKQELPFFSKRACEVCINQLEPLIAPKGVKRAAKRTLPPPPLPAPKKGPVRESDLTGWLVGGELGENRIEAWRRINEVKREQGNTLDLKGLHLSTLPGSVGSLSHLTSLDLRDNPLKVLPNTLSYLPAQTIVELDGTHDSLLLHRIASQPHWLNLHKNTCVLFSHGAYNKTVFLTSYWNVRSLLQHLFEESLPAELDGLELQKVLTHRQSHELEGLEKFLMALPLTEDYLNPETRPQILERLIKVFQGLIHHKAFTNLIFFPVLFFTPKQLDGTQAAFLLAKMESGLLGYDDPQNREANSFDVILNAWISEEKRGEQRERAACLIRDAKDEGHKSLCLKNLNLSSLPSLFEDLPLLEHLDLSGNRFTSLPSSLITDPRWIALGTFTIIYLPQEYEHSHEMIHFLSYMDFKECLHKTLDKKRFNELDIVALQQMLLTCNSHDLTKLTLLFSQLPRPKEMSDNDFQEQVFLILWTMIKIPGFLQEILSNQLKDSFEVSLTAWVLMGHSSEKRKEAAHRMRQARACDGMVLDLMGLRLRSLPEALTKLDHLMTLVLSHNHLTTLPESLIDLPNISNLYCDHNPPALYSSKTWWDLTYYWALTNNCEIELCGQFPSNWKCYAQLRPILYTLFEGSLPDLIDYRNLSRHLNVKTTEELTLLNRFLKKLTQMKDYQELDTRPRTLERITRVLQGFASHPTFLEAALIDLSGRTEACIDEIALTFSQIEILRLLHCQSPHATSEELAKILIGLKRLELVDTWALMRSLIGSNVTFEGGRLLDLSKTEARRVRDSEVLEGSFAMRILLKERLWLPVETQTMQFQSCAEEELGPLEEAAEACHAEVLSFTSHLEDVLPLLMENETWRKRIDEETEKEWVAMQDTPPLAQFHQFLLNFLEEEMQDEEKIVCLKETPISIQEDDGTFKSLFVIQQQVLKKMKDMHTQLHLDASSDLLLRLGIKRRY